MKKSFYFILPLFVTVFLLTACGGSKKEQSTENEPVEGAHDEEAEARREAEEAENVENYEEVEEDPIVHDPVEEWHTEFLGQFEGMYSHSLVSFQIEDMNANSFMFRLTYSGEGSCVWEKTGTAQYIGQQQGKEAFEYISGTDCRVLFYFDPTNNQNIGIKRANCNGLDEGCLNSDMDYLEKN